MPNRRHTDHSDATPHSSGRPEFFADLDSQLSRRVVPCEPSALTFAVDLTSMADALRRVDQIPTMYSDRMTTVSVSTEASCVRRSSSARCGSRIDSSVRIETTRRDITGSRYPRAVMHGNPLDRPILVARSAAAYRPTAGQI